ncbi:MAG: hypothetical protein ACRC1H_06460, partial [Caldilineaceae bacterium]
MRLPTPASRSTSPKSRFTVRPAFRLFLALAVLMLALAALPAAAQEPAPDATPDQLTKRGFLPTAFRDRPINCVCVANALTALPNGAPVAGE